MSKISKDAAQAFLEGEPFERQNTEVMVRPSGQVEMYLHDNRIAWRHQRSGRVHMSLAGWPTVTTKSRLNAICSRVRGRQMFSTRKHVPCFDGEPISVEDWIAI